MDTETLKCISACVHSTANETSHPAVAIALRQLADRLDNVISSEEIVHEHNGVPIRTGIVPATGIAITPEEIAAKTDSQSGGATTAVS